MSTKKLQIIDYSVKQAENADTLDGKHAVEFAAAADVSDLQTKVGDMPVADQITSAVNSAGILTIDITDAEAGTVNLINADSLGGVAASGYLLKTETAADSNMLGGKAPIYYIQPRNLLDNSDFRNPVNQRGVTTSVNSFIVDRWYTFNDFLTGDATLTDSGITMTGDAYLQHRLPSGTLPTEFTLAVYYSDGTVDVGTNGVCVSGDEFDLVNYVRSNGKTISHIALYEGTYTADTLPPYVPKGYAAELAECQRYYRTFKYPVIPCANNPSGTTVYGFLPINMRTGVSLAVLIDALYFFKGDGTFVPVNSATAAIYGTGIRIVFVLNSSVTSNLAGAVAGNAITLSADL